MKVKSAKVDSTPSGPQKANTPTKLEYILFIAQLIISIVVLVVSANSIYLMVTDPSRYQDVIRRLYESAQKNNPVLPFIPPDITPLVKEASGLSFALVSSVRSAVLLWIALVSFAGIAIGYVIKKKLSQGRIMLRQSNTKKKSPTESVR